MERIEVVVVGGFFDLHFVDGRGGGRRGFSVGVDAAATVVIARRRVGVGGDAACEGGGCRVRWSGGLVIGKSSSGAHEPSSCEPVEVGDSFLG